MEFVSTRNRVAVASCVDAINRGLAPDGGLYVPSLIPRVAPDPDPGGSYHATARSVLEALLPGFTPAEVEHCVDAAYGSGRFDADDVIEVPRLEQNRWLLELWHGPTAAFKDIALQFMPILLETARRKAGQKEHTVVLVATSGDTGKAALEGFKDREGVSIIVFYPQGGVSEMQRLQMITTTGNNTHVIAVRGNFDDCQNGVKSLFGDGRLRQDLAEKGVVFSSANSINWGRLCPQVVYYYRTWEVLTARGELAPGQELSFVVPSGNFGNILAAWYARQMGLPIGRLYCASNRNRILADFFQTGRYDRNRSFHRTMSPSMDILVSSNLERFLFELSGHDDARIRAWYDTFAYNGSFEVDGDVRQQLARTLTAGWVDEGDVAAAIRNWYRRTGRVLDPHTAVAASLCDNAAGPGEPVVIDATASPHKFPADVLTSLSTQRHSDEFAALEALCALEGSSPHPALEGLRQRPVCHQRVIDSHQMEQAVRECVGGSAG